MSETPSPTAAIEPKGPERVSRFDPFGLRVLVITWSLWLLTSWSITLAFNATVHAVRWVIFSAVFGLMAVWPALRLSQQLPWYPPYGRGSGVRGVAASATRRVLATGLDWLCLLAVLQVVIWPLMLLGRWSVEQTFWLNMAVVSWSLLTGALVGLGRVLPGAWARLGAMVLCMLLLVGEPIWRALYGLFFAVSGSGEPAGQMRISPIQALWELTTTTPPYDPGQWVPVILSTAAAAGLAWGVLIVMAVVLRER